MANSQASTVSGERELVVITKADAKLRASEEGVRSLGGADVSSLSSLLSSQGVTLEPLFGASEERLERDVSGASAFSNEEALDLESYYRVQADDAQLDNLAETLLQDPLVEAAYIKPAPQPAVDVLEREAPELESLEALNTMTPSGQEAPPATADFMSRQGYLNASPEGVDAPYAWTLSGGRGAGVGVIDIEGGWNFAHEDLTQNQGGVIDGTQRADWVNHGTAVVGEIGGDRNTFGVTGICPDANVRAISIFGVGTAAAIKKATDASKAGDIILIELHAPGPEATGQGQVGFVAMEWWPDNFAAIRYAVAKGVIVVEAAGNGGVNYDAAIYNVRPNGFPASWKNPFNPSNPSSGAVLVGAGAPPPGTHGRNHGPDRSRLGFSNYGARVDVQGWGREVTTTGYGDLQGGSNKNLWYTDRFSGTSSASPIVVGALGCIQGILRAQGGTLLTSAAARTLLRNTGAPQQDAPGRPKTQRIGNRPNLRQAIPSIAKVWQNQKKVVSTFANAQPDNAWAYIEDIGWRKIKANDNAAISHMFSSFCDAVVSGRKVNVYVDKQFVYIMYLL